MTQLCYLHTIESRLDELGWVSKVWRHSSKIGGDAGMLAWLVRVHVCVNGVAMLRWDVAKLKHRNLVLSDAR